MSSWNASSPSRSASRSSNVSWPGQSGASVSFQCVGDTDYSGANDFAVFALQCLLAMLVVCVALAIGALLWRRSHKPE